MTDVSRRTSLRLQAAPGLASGATVSAQTSRDYRSCRAQSPASQSHSSDVDADSAFDFWKAKDEVSRLVDGAILTFDQLVRIFGFFINDDGTTVSHADIYCDLCLRPLTGSKTPCPFKEIRYCVIGAEWSSLLGSIYQPRCLKWETTPKLSMEGCHPPRKGQIRCMTGIGELQNPAVLNSRHYEQIKEHTRLGKLGPCSPYCHVAPGEKQVDDDEVNKQTILLRLKRPGCNESRDPTTKKGLVELPSGTTDSFREDHLGDAENIVGGSHNDDLADKDSWIDDIPDNLSRFDSDEGGDQFIRDGVAASANETQAFNRDVCGRYMAPMFREFTRRDQIRARHLAEADGRLVSLEADLKVLEEDNTAQKRKYDTLEVEASSLRRRKRRLVAERHKLRETQRRLESDLAQKKDDMERLIDDKKQLGHEIDRLTELAKHRDADVERLSRYAQERDGDIDRLQAEIVRLKAEAKGKEALQREHDGILSMVKGLTKYMNAKS